jgi:hypothetical protein
MHISRQQLVPALAGLCLGAIGAVSFFVLRDSVDSTARPASSVAASPSALSGGSHPTGAPSGNTPVSASKNAVVDLACASEPLRQEAEMWRGRVTKLAEAARKRGAALRIEDPNFDDLTAAVSMRPDPNDLPNLEKLAVEQSALVEEQSARWQRVLDRSAEEFERTAPKDPSNCGMGIFYVMLRQATEEAAKLRATGAGPDDERLRALETQITNSQSSLVASAVYQERRELDGTRQTLDGLKNPDQGIASYLAIKAEYLAAKQAFEEVQRRYETARLIPLPAARTKDWRQAATR